MWFQKELKENLQYDPYTGIFVWLVDRGNRIKAGMVAGTKSPDGYIRINLSGKPELAHRVAFVYMTGSVAEFVDHKDLDKANNKWTNLRECTKSQNQFNVPVRKHNKLGVKGVHLHISGKYRADGKINGKSVYLGLHLRIEDAIQAYNDFNLKHNSQFHLKAG